MNQNFAKLGQQLRTIWEQLGVSQKLSVVLATTVVFGGMLALAFWSNRVDYALLYGRLPEGEAAKVIAALDDAKVPYKIGSGGNAILVPSDKVHLMRMQLAGRGLPRGEGVGFEIFDKPNFGISDFVQRANYLRAVQGELERTISQLDEIEGARVMVVQPENRLLMDKDKHPTASVFVRVKGNGMLSSSSVNSIRFLVANSVEGLKPNYVSVVDNRGNSLSENMEGDPLIGLTTSQLAARRNLESYLAKKAEAMLEKVLGPGQAIVRVAAEINLDTVTRTEEKFDPDGAVIRSQTKNDENNDSGPVNNGSGVVGVSMNATAETNAPTTAATSTRTKKTTGTTEYEVSKSTSNTVQTAGGLKRCTAAVTIAAEYEGTGTARKVKARSPEDLQRLQRIVESALGVDTTRGDKVTLEEMVFNDKFETEMTQRMDKQQSQEFWWNIARNLIYPLLGVGALYFLWRLFKSTPVESIPIGISLSALRTNGNGHSNGNGNGNGHSFPMPEWRREGAPNQVTVEVLNQLIKENPTNMTHAIRNWLARGNPQSR